MSGIGLRGGVRSAIAVLTALGLIITHILAPPLTSASTAIPNFDHIFLVMMENRSYYGSGTNAATGIIGSAEAPYINGTLVPMGGLATNYHAITHASLPNYLALTNGRDYSASATITGDCSPNTSGCSSFIVGTNLADRLEVSGRSWKAYMESMPSNCDKQDSGYYAVRHNAFAYYASLGSCAAQDVPYQQLSTDLLSPTTTPDFVLIVPNVCDDMHGASTCPDTRTPWVQQGDTWLQRNLPTIFHSLAWTAQDSLLLLVWDEGAGGFKGEQCQSSSHALDVSCHVIALLIGSNFPAENVKTKYLSSRYYDHFSLLRTIETAWSLAPMGSGTNSDGEVGPMSDVFAGF